MLVSLNNGWKYLYDCKCKNNGSFKEYAPKSRDMTLTGYNEGERLV